MVASVRSQKRSSWSYKKNKSAYGSRTSSRQCRYNSDPMRSLFLCVMIQRKWTKSAYHRK
ncbi:hypothetical protein HanXRQr2_Chr17g0828001 [Helianthus annuus]|uniref:Uncharacterized protein n=1 Tax=Helianthus annuus TaxID=4232 RepID=A0A9K3DLH9_HELAN|nr:hypothetical protein HanXRQr2_Chr17g0828001 [Helianthus annuus]